MSATDDSTTDDSTVVVLGSANLDLVYRVPRIPEPGETLLATGAEQHPGGKGNNQVIAVSRAGAAVSFIAAIGLDAAGDVLMESLMGAGVGDLVRRVDEPSGTALITVDDSGENTIVVNSGSNATLTGLTESERHAIARADYLLMQLETPIDTVIAAARIAREAGTKVVMNAAPIRRLPEALIANVDVLVVNEHEALILAADLVEGHRLPQSLTTDNAHDVAAHLLTAVPAVVITLGGDGAVVLTREMEDAPAAHVPAARVAAVDTTGAGDTFCGAFVAALSAGDDLVEAVSFATSAGAISVQRSGAVPSIPTRKEIDDFRATD